MGAGSQRQPVGVGAYTGGEPSEKAPEDLAFPTWPEGTAPPPPRMRRTDFVVFALIVSALVITSTIILLDVAVPREYPQHVSLSLDAGNQWNAYACIPTWSAWGGPGSIEVSFSWTSPSPADLVMVPHDMILQDAAYNVTGTSGSSSYQATANPQYENNVDLEFVALSEPTMPAFVNISISFDVPGHVLAPPNTPVTC